MPIRLLLSVLKLLLVASAIVCLWALLHIEALHELAEGYERRNMYVRRLEAAHRELRRLRDERTELARGGFPAEKVIREKFRYGLPDERLLLVETDGGEVGPSGRRARRERLRRESAAEAHVEEAAAAGDDANGADNSSELAAAG